MNSLSDALKHEQPIPFPETGKGTYVLILRLPRPAAITIGRLGAFHFPAGCYAYVGSAFGAGGLRGRLKHHLSPVKKPHWHVDYLRQAAAVDAVWYCVDETPCECEWANALRSLPDADMPAPRFGASDCDCPAHLFHFEGCPDVTRLAPLLGPVQEVNDWPAGC